MNSNQPKGHVPSWRIPALLLLLVFVVLNFNLVNGKGAPLWDAYAYFAPAFTLVADHARAGSLVLWNPWTSGGTPDVADPEAGTASPLQVLVGAIMGGTELGFRVYWLLFWFLGALGILVLARHLAAPRWAGFVVSVGLTFSGFYTGHAEHTATLHSFAFLPWFLWRFDVALASGRLRPAAEAGAIWGFSSLAGYPALTILSGGFLFLWALGRLLCGSSEQSDTSGIPGRQTSRQWLFSGTALALVAIVGVLVIAPTYL